MNREIKFRAWIPSNYEGQPQMFYQESQYLGSFLRRANLHASNMEHDKYGVDAEPPKLFLLQYTGLKDKSGKEIYEGDVVRHRKLDRDNDWLKYGISEMLIDTNGVEVKWSYAGFYPLSGWVDIEDLEYEVIGNIYENPELLGKEGV